MLYGLHLNDVISNLIWSRCSLENSIISVERIQRFCDITSEALTTTKETRPLRDWPSHGTVEIQDLQVSIWLSRMAFSIPFVRILVVTIYVTH